MMPRCAALGAARRAVIAVALLGPVATRAQPSAATPDPVTFMAAARGAPQQPATPCAALAATPPAMVTIVAAVARPAGPLTTHGPRGDTVVDLPAHCVVTGTIDRRTAPNGKTRGIRFELRLPTAWNGRFLFQGGGGLNGVVQPALGTVKGPPALARGFAVVTQDAGHDSPDASFGADQQARIDMIYRSYDRVTAMAKAIVASYYGKRADRSYFMGCSEGGREALLVSQRMPLDYDGVVAGDPGLLLGVSFDDVAGRMALTRIVPLARDGRPDLAKAFSPVQLAALEGQVEADCDDRDGLKDGIIDNPQACRPRLERLACAGQATATCLTAPQIATLRAIFDGGLPAGNGVTTAGYFYDTAIDTPPWAGKLAGFGGLPTPGVDSIAGLFSTPYDPKFDTFGIDFAKDGARFDEVGRLNRTDAVNYSSFTGHGGKLLIYTGLADQAFSAKALIAYYQRVAASNGGATVTANFARLFLVPGMTHCRGGKALDEFDPLAAVVRWVESATPPERLVSTGTAFPGRSRPLCPFPLQSRYAGTGSIDVAVNFTCRAATTP